MNLSILRGLLKTHTRGERPFIALPPSNADRAALEVRLHPYRIRQAHLSDEPTDLTARRLLDNGWPSNL